MSATPPQRSVAPGAAADVRGRAITVMGLGLQGGGVEVARWLARRGARVTVTDLRPESELCESIEALRGERVSYALAGHRVDDFSRADLVVANPAVAPSSPFLAAAREAGVPVTTETALFLDACPARLVLVTGTQGKSSTCHLAWSLLREAGFAAVLGGNIGRSLLGELESLTADHVVVLELSSYQLEALPAADLLGGLRTAAIGVVNVLPDHLERHGTIEAYEGAKRRILELAGPDTWVVLSGEDPRVARWRPERGRVVRLQTSRPSALGLNLCAGRFRLDTQELGRVDDLRLPGPFQRDNTLCALGLALAAGAAPEKLARAIPHLSGLEHRLQDLGLVRGHRVWDNGVSTTPDSTLSAVLALGGPLALLIGGQMKRLPLSELVAAARGRARRVIAFGASGPALASEFEAADVPAETVADVPAAVAHAFAAMGRDEALLFSPACASFDAYRNFRDRARDFRAALAQAARRHADGAGA